MKYSESTKSLLKAIHKFQDEVRPIIKDGKNPHFKSTYARLEDCLDTARPALSKNGLVITQPTSFQDGITVLHTRLSHVESGEYMEADWPLIPIKNDPQGLGSANTYGRRYSFLNVLGLAPEDDDGNAASHPKPTATSFSRTVSDIQAPKPATTYLERQEVADSFAVPPLDANDGGDYMFPFGKYKSKQLRNVNSADIEGYCEYLIKKGREDGKPRSENMKQFYGAIDRYLGTNFVSQSAPASMSEVIKGLEMKTDEVPF